MCKGQTHKYVNAVTQTIKKHMITLMCLNQQGREKLDYIKEMFCFLNLEQTDTILDQEKKTEKKYNKYN